jgi:post-segregation antitoxin (ccd killing protein)
MKQYIKVKVIKITESQDQTLKKLRSYKINVSQFIRDAIQEKIKREYFDLIPKPEKEKIPF